jgi:hypothetical protein
MEEIHDSIVERVVLMLAGKSQLHGNIVKSYEVR